jgi:hypothetical protein
MVYSIRASSHHCHRQRQVKSQAKQVVVGKHLVLVVAQRLRSKVGAKASSGSSCPTTQAKGYGGKLFGYGSRPMTQKQRFLNKPLFSFR